MPRRVGGNPVVECSVVTAVAIVLSIGWLSSVAHAQERPGATGQSAGQPGQAPSQSGTEPPRFTSEDTRLIVGTSSRSFSSQSSVVTYVIDLGLTAPLSKKTVTMTTKPRFGAWLGLRLAGEPLAKTPNIKQFAAGFDNGATSGGLSTVLQTSDALMGVEMSLANGFTFGGHYQFEPLLVAGAGFVTTPSTTGTIPIFNMTDEARQKFVPEGIDGSVFKYLGFAQPDRANFHAQYYVGIRLKTHHFERRNPSARVNFPGTIDLTVGRNSFVSGGTASPWVARLDAFYPLPTDNVANAVYVFAGAFLHLTDRTPERPAIFLSTPSAAVPVPSSDLFIHTLTPEERRRDLWHFGIAVDLVRLFTAQTQNQTQNQNQNR